jgi:uncharacterized phage-associated protein
MGTNKPTQVYDPKAVANRIIEIAEEKKLALDHMKLQKLIYFAHGWCLAISGEPLINEPIEAWKFGPVINSIYHAFKRFGSGVITQKAVSFDGCDFVIPTVGKDDTFTNELLETIVKAYGREFTAIQLSNMSHEQGSPWEVTWKKKNPDEQLKYLQIENEEIKDYFTKLSERSR